MRILGLLSIIMVLSSAFMILLIMNSWDDVGVTQHLHAKLHDRQPEEEEEDIMEASSHSGGHKNILILASHRTGSTFVGEFFNQHGDNMFYLFEPLWHVDKRLEAGFGSVLAGIYLDVLRGLFLCDFNPLEKFINPSPKNHMTSECPDAMRILGLLSIIMVLSSAFMILLIMNSWDDVGVTQHLHAKLHDRQPEEEEEDIMEASSHSGGHKNILILASHRTGSTFVGEFFNQHGDNMFYLFEPLWHVDKRLEAGFGSVLAGIYLDVLRGLFLCDFNPLEKFINPSPKNHMTSEWLARWCSMALCKKPVCPAELKDVWKQCNMQTCGPLNLSLASQSCLTKEHRAIKTVRLRQLDILRPLVEDPRLDLRVIQLVRDPRAILASRMATFPDEYRKWKTWARQGKVPEDDELVKWLKRECDSVRMSAMVGLSRPRWLRRRYMLLRYEDVTRYPMQKAEEIYSFAGIPFSWQAREWILRNTQTADISPWSTKKNSLEQADKWRSSLPYELARVAQMVCGPTMELFGYSLVDDEKTLVNKSVSLLDPLYLM